MSRVVRSRAPLRLSFCGGGTDVSPYPEERGGVVLSSTIDKYAYASVQPRRDARFGIHSLDYDVVARYPHARSIALDGNLDLIKAVVRAFRPKKGADLFVHSDAPPGSGLGSSSTIAVDNGSLSLSGDVGGTGTLTLAGSGSGTLSGALNQSGGLSKTGSGTWTACGGGSNG